MVIQIRRIAEELRFSNQGEVILQSVEVWEEVSKKMKVVEQEITLSFPVEFNDRGNVFGEIVTFVGDKNFGLSLSEAIRMANAQVEWVGKDNIRYGLRGVAEIMEGLSIALTVTKRNKLRGSFVVEKGGFSGEYTFVAYTQFEALAAACQKLSS